MSPYISLISANHAQWLDGDQGIVATGENMIRLDLRHLHAPEPMYRILETLETLPTGHSLLARTPCRPQPLLDILDDRGYRVIVNVTRLGDAWVQIFSTDDCTSR